jgi:ribosomal protein S18 acetylase RimI-like enzyme
MALRRAVIALMRSDRMNFTVRRAGLDDAPALSLIGQATFLESYYMDVGRDDMIAHLKTTYSERCFVAHLQKPSVAIWLAEFEPALAPIGFAAVCAPELSIETKATDLQLLHIYVLSPLYGAQVGSALMETAITFAREQKAERLVLCVWSENHRALAFYRRNAFETLGISPCQVGARVYEDLVLAKSLA